MSAKKKTGESRDDRRRELMATRRTFYLSDDADLALTRFAARITAKSGAKMTRSAVVEALLLALNTADPKHEAVTDAKGLSAMFASELKGRGRG